MLISVFAVVDSANPTGNSRRMHHQQLRLWRSFGTETCSCQEFKQKATAYWCCHASNSLLDPSTKDLVELDQQSKIELLVEAVVTNMARLPDAALVSGTSTSSPTVAFSEQAVVGSDDDSSMTVQEQQGMHIDELKPVSKRRRLLLKHRVESEPQEAVRTEVNAYLQAKVGDDVDDDQLIFWKNAKGLDHLKQLAKVILTRSEVSVDVECMFSTMGLILNGKRAQSADALSFIHDNFFLVAEDD